MVITSKGPERKIEWLMTPFAFLSFFSPVNYSRPLLTWQDMFHLSNSVFIVSIPIKINNQIKFSKIMTWNFFGFSWNCFCECLSKRCCQSKQKKKHQSHLVKPAVARHFIETSSESFGQNCVENRVENRVKVVEDTWNKMKMNNLKVGKS